LPSLKQNSK